MKVSRNVSVSNREVLESAGLHWHGRDGGWIGSVTHTQLADLRRVFGKRVEKPELAGAEEDPGTPQKHDADDHSADVEAIATPAEEEQGQADTAAPGAQSASTATTRLRSSFGFPSRRPTAT